MNKVSQFDEKSDIYWSSSYNDKYSTYTNAQNAMILRHMDFDR